MKPHHGSIQQPNSYSSKRWKSCFKIETAIIIAHRLTTLQRADEILVLDAGEVIEYGARTNLANNPASHYAQLRQFDLTNDAIAPQSLKAARV